MISAFSSDGLLSTTSFCCISASRAPHGTAHSSKERRRPLFWRPFWTVTEPAPCLLVPLLDSWRQDGENSEKTAKKRAKMGEIQPSKKSAGCPSMLAQQVSKPAVYTFLRDFLSEMASIFTDQYLFLGKPHRRLGPLSFLRHNNLGQAATRSTSVVSKTRRISQPGCGSTV